MAGSHKKTTKLVQSVEVLTSEQDYDECCLETPNGPVIIRSYASPGATASTLMVGGVGGDFDSPANGLYPRIAERLKKENISSVRVQFRDPIDLDRSIHDVLAGIEFLTGRGVNRVALIGHSFGGAVVIQAALRCPAVATVVTLASQGFGTEGIEDLSPCSIFFIHGYQDEVLPPSCSIDAYNRAKDPKSLKVFPGARHVLNEVAEEVYRDVHGWVVEKLSPVLTTPRP